jgi:hypothetical protein
MGMYGSEWRLAERDFKDASDSAAPP